MEHDSGRSEIELMIVENLQEGIDELSWSLASTYGLGDEFAERLSSIGYVFVNKNLSWFVFRDILSNPLTEKDISVQLKSVASLAAKFGSRSVEALKVIEAVYEGADWAELVKYSSFSGRKINLKLREINEMADKHVRSKGYAYPIDTFRRIVSRELGPEWERTYLHSGNHGNRSAGNDFRRGQIALEGFVESWSYE